MKDKKTKPILAILSIIFSVLSICCCCAGVYSIPMAIVGIVLGAISKSKGKKGIGQASIIIGIIGIILGSVVTGIGILPGSEKKTAQLDTSEIVEEYTEPINDNKSEQFVEMPDLKDVALADGVSNLAEANISNYRVETKDGQVVDLNDTGSWKIESQSISPGGHYKEGAELLLIVSALDKVTNNKTKETAEADNGKNIENNQLEKKQVKDDTIINEKEEKNEEQKIIEEEKKKAEEQKKLEEEKKKAEEQKKLEEEKKKAAEEQQRILAEQQAAEQQRILAEQQAAEQQRILAEQQAAEQQRILAEQQAAEQQRIIAEQQAAEQQRILAEQQAAEQQRIAAEAAAQQAQVPQGDSTLVWVPNTGARYHRKSNCSGMINPRQVTVNQAIAEGYTPCGRCY